MQNGIILSKISVIEEYVLKLQNYVPASFDQFQADWGLRKIWERSLQVMIEVMIDIAERIIATKDVVPQKTAAETMKKLRELGIIKNDDTYIKMVRFRNLVVHNYDSIDAGILFAIVNNNLNDFKSFVDEIKQYEGI